MRLSGFVGAIAKAQKTAVHDRPAKFDWTPFADTPQEQAYYNEAEETFYGGSAGGGKGGICHGLQWAFRNKTAFTVDQYNDIIDEIPDWIKRMDSKVLMWNGEWKNFSEISVDDRIMNPDGQMQTVIQVHERGEQEVYIVKFEDGTSVECDGDHLWGFWRARTNTRRKTCPGVKPILDRSILGAWNVNYISRAMIRNTKWLYEEVLKGKRIIIPVIAPLNFTQLHRGRVDRAYVYGALIGDGCIQRRRKSGIVLTNVDEWVIERCTSLMEDWRRRDSPNKATDTCFKDDWVEAWAENTGLIGKYSYNKFIPEGYLKESLEFRWNLAQGLFDTDGYASSTANEVSYCTVSPQLAEDVANLVRSLGFIAKVREKQGVCYLDGLGKECRMAYIVRVEGNNRHRLFSLPRKVELAKLSEPNHWVGKRIESIEKKGSVYCRCITVSNANGLYITDGYNVTHNSDLILGLALTAHESSIIYRKEYPQLKALIRRSHQIIGQVGRYNGQEKTWKLPGDRLLEFGAVGSTQTEIERYQGRPHDFIAIDEGTHIQEWQYRFLIGWNRTTTPGQRCRVVVTGNPPTTSQGRWVIKYWSPWLDPRHPNPAEPGEIRWFASIEGKTVELENGDPFEHQGELIIPRSRTFIPARLDDNPHLARSGYRAVLQGMPEPLRSQLLYGSFDIEPESDPWQVIPTNWVKAAVQRWKELPPDRQTHMGVDVARGGKDQTVIALRNKHWIAPLICLPGSITPDGDAVVDHILMNHVRDCEIRIDVVGVGASPYDALKRMNKGKTGSERMKIYAMSGGKKSEKTDRSGQLGFVNLRAEWWWHLRELLDPAKGIGVALPDDSILIEDLTAPRWWKTSNDRIQVESKEDLAKADRLGRSPDRGDAVVYAFAEPSKDTKSGEVVRALMRG